MVTACLISTTMNWEAEENVAGWDDHVVENYDPMDGPSEEEAYLQGMSLFDKQSVDLHVVPNRGVQDDIATCRRTLSWKSRQTAY